MKQGTAALRPFVMIPFHRDVMVTRETGPGFAAIGPKIKITRDSAYDSVRNMERDVKNDTRSAPDPARILDRKVALTRAILLFERIWRALLWPFAAAGIFLLLSFAGAWTALPSTAHTILIVLFALAGLASLAPLFRIAMPDRETALRRLEEHSGIRHRPATSYEDALPETATGEQRAIWAAHRERLAALFGRLRPGMPRPRLDRADPYALRAALFLLLTVSLVSAGPQAWDRMRSAFQWTPPDLGIDYRLDAWATPPVYTGKPPVVLADGSNEQGVRAVSVPEKSLLVVRVNGGPGAEPALRISGGEGEEDTVVKPESYQDGLAEYRLTLTEDRAISVSIGTFTASTWHFDLIRDKPPVIALAEEPSRTPRGSLRLGFRTEDDYGVASAEAEFALAGESGDKLAERSRTAGENSPLAPPVIPLNLPRANAKIAEAKIFRDLTAHPWAGLKVEMTLVARDQAGQEGRSEPYEMVLPEREFTKPLAKAVIEQRKNLVRDPGALGDVAQAVAALTIGGEKFIEDKVVYLGLRSVFWRLRNTRAEDPAASAVEQLWDIALRIEDGDLPEAQAALRAAQEALRKALEEGASDEEIQRLVQELRAALNNFLQAMAEQARRNGNLAEMPEGLGEQQMMSSKDLEEMLRNIENLAKSGARDMAQQMLSELQNMLERLQMGAMNQNSRGQQMMKMVQGLGEIISKQQKLLDETYRQNRQRGEQGQQGQPGQQGQQGEGRFGQQGEPRFGQQGRQGQGQQGQRQGQGGQRGQGQQGQGQGRMQFGDLGGEQRALREKLDQLLEQLRSFGAKPPDQLDGAGQAMGEAEGALQEENLDRATQQQTLALDRLRQGTQQMAEQVLQSLASRMGRGDQGRKDPLGRPERTQGPDLGTSVQVPDEIDIQRAREILEELRRRLSDPSRPMIELDYLERLLRQF